MATKFQPFKVTDTGSDSIRVCEVADRHEIFVAVTHGRVFLTAAKARKLADGLTKAADCMDGAYPTFTDDFVEL